MSKTPNDKTLILTTLYQTNRYNQDLYIKQQWKIFYFTMIAHSVIYFLCKSTSFPMNYIIQNKTLIVDAGVLLFVSYWLMVISLYVLWNLECSLMDSRWIDFNLRIKIGDGEINAILEESGVKINKPPQKSMVFWILWFLNIAAFLIVSYLILYQSFAFYLATVLVFLTTFVCLHKQRKCKSKKSI